MKSSKRKKNTLNIHKKGKAFICLSVCYFRCHKWRHYWISSQFCMTEETGTSQAGVPEQSLIRLNLIIAPTYSLSQGSAAAGEERCAPWQLNPWSSLTATVKSVHFFFIERYCLAVLSSEFLSPSFHSQRSSSCVGYTEKH